jgi:hypothetical protein
MPTKRLSLGKFSGTERALDANFRVIFIFFNFDEVLFNVNFSFIDPFFWGRNFIAGASLGWNFCQDFVRQNNSGSWQISWRFKR